MDVLDQMIRTGVRRAVDQVAPAADLWARVERGLAAPQPARPWAPALAVLAAGAVALAAALPGPRTLAAAVLERVFRIAGVVYGVGNWVPSDPLPTGSREGQVEVPIQETVLAFTGEPGQFPGAARQAIQGLGPAFRIPGWLPPGMAVRIYIYRGAGREAADPGNGPTAAPGGPQSVEVVLGDDDSHAIFITQMAPVPAEVQTLSGSGDPAAEEVDLGSVRALEVRTGRMVSYHFTADGVHITVSGPLAEAEMVRRVAESLAF